MLGVGLIGRPGRKGGKVGRKKGRKGGEEGRKGKGCRKVCILMVSPVKLFLLSVAFTETRWPRQYTVS